MCLLLGYKPTQCKIKPRGHTTEWRHNLMLESNRNERYIKQEIITAQHWSLEEQLSKTTWHEARLFNVWKQEEVGHFHPSVLALCDYLDSTERMAVETRDEAKHKRDLLTVNSLCKTLAIFFFFVSCLRMPTVNRFFVFPLSLSMQSLKSDKTHPICIPVISK